VAAAVVAVAPWPTLILSRSGPPPWYIVAIPVVDGNKVSPVFSRSQDFVIVDVKTNRMRTIRNPSHDEPHGTGPTSAKLLLEENVGVVIAREIGPEPFNRLTARGVGVYVGNPSTVDEALYQLERGMLAKARTPTQPTHYGVRKQKQALDAPRENPNTSLPSSPAPPAMPLARSAVAFGSGPTAPTSSLPTAPAAQVPLYPAPGAPSWPTRSVDPLAAGAIPTPAARPLAGPYQVPKLALEVVGSSSGVRVHRVYRGSVAERAGLRPGDLIVGFGSSRIIEVAHFVQAVAAAREESTASIDIFRAGQVLRRNVAVGEGEMESATVPYDPAPVYRQPSSVARNFNRPLSAQGW
jgi:predicted Fe-Mo cluster-binding NifX family protein